MRGGRAEDDQWLLTASSSRPTAVRAAGLSTIDAVAPPPPPASPFSATTQTSAEDAGLQRKQHQKAHDEPATGRPRCRSGRGLGLRGPLRRHCSGSRRLTCAHGGVTDVYFRTPPPPPSS